MVNAICHRDYSIEGSDIKFAIYDDIIEVTSPGTLPGSLTTEDLGTGISELRNRIVGRIFNEIGLIEQWGTGFNRMRKNLDEYGLPMPEINLKGRFFQVSFRRRDPDQSMEVANSESLNSTEHKIIELIKEKGRIQTKDCIQAIPGKSEKTIRRKLKGLEEKKIIRWDGSSRTDPTGYYVLVTELTEQ